MPSEQCRAHLPPKGYVKVSKSLLKFGVRFLLNRFFRDVLRYYFLIMFQVTPNKWAHMIMLFGLFMERNMGPPTPKEFSWFYTLKANKSDQGFYYFAKRAAKGLQAFTKIRESLGNWKDNYFFTLEVYVWGSFAPSKYL